MKKFYFLFLIIPFIGFGQTPILTAIVDGDCSGGKPKVVEIYAKGEVDFTQYKLQLQANANTDWTDTDYANFDLSVFGTVTDAFVYIYGEEDQAIFEAEFPSAGNAQGGTATSFNGDDRIRIINVADGSVIDIFGEDGVDGTDSAWEYKDGYAKRNDNTSASATFNVADWTVANGALDGQGTCQQGDTFETVMGGIGTYVNTLSVVNPNFNKKALKVAVNNGNLVVQGADVKNIEVYNVAGQKVANSTYVGNLAKGVYIAVVEDNNGNKTSVKFIK